jgi:hypothetical protein
MQPPSVIRQAETLPRQQGKCMSADTNCQRMTLVTDGNNIGEARWRTQNQLPTSRNLAREVGEVTENETIKYGNESRGTQARERLRWWDPATTENYRPVLSSEK